MNRAVHERWLFEAYCDNEVPVLRIPHPEIPDGDYEAVKEQLVAQTWHEGPR